MALTKDPDATLDYAFAWADWLEDGETIVDHTVTVESGDVIIDSTSRTVDTVIAWVSGGTLGTNAEITNHILTSEGREDDRTIILLIREVAAVAGCESWPVIGYTPPDEASEETIAAAEEAAQAFLNGATGRRFGTCTYVQRFQVRQPSYARCAVPFHSSNCCAIPLPNRPVQSIIAVKVDGVLVPSNSYTVLGGSRLGRVGGCWPTSEDCVPGRVEVSYTAGIPLRPGSTYYAMAGAAMGELVREYMLAFSGAACKLPSRFQAVTRQGVSNQGLDPKLFLDLKLTGMPLTDNFIRTVNPSGARRPSRVLSIDGPRRN